MAPDGKSSFNDVNERYPLYRQKKNSGVFSKLKEPMTIEHVKKVCEDVGIGYSGIKIAIIDAPGLKGSGFTGYTYPDGNLVALYPDAFINREALIRTLAHERMHVMQVKLYGPPQNSLDGGAFENGSKQAEVDWIDYYHNIYGGK
jgi:hypothetical protein